MPRAVVRERHIEEECADSRPRRPRWRANPPSQALGRTGPVHQPALQCLEQAFLSRTHGTPPHIQTSAASVPCHVLVSRLHTGLKPRRREHMVRCSPEAPEPRQPLHSSSSVRPSVRPHSSCLCQALGLLHTSCPSPGLCAHTARAQLPALPSPHHCEGLPPSFLSPQEAAWLPPAGRGVSPGSAEGQLCVPKGPDPSFPNVGGRH